MGLELVEKCLEKWLFGVFWEGYFFWDFFPFFLGFFSRFLVEGRCEEGRKEGRKGKERKGKERKGKDRKEGRKEGRKERGPSST